MLFKWRDISDDVPHDCTVAAALRCLTSFSHVSAPAQSVLHPSDPVQILLPVTSEDALTEEHVEGEITVFICFFFLLINILMTKT